MARAAAEAEVPQQAGALVPDRQGYRSFQLEGCEFLVAETEGGALDLHDVYVTADVHPDGGGPLEDASYRRLEGHEEVTRKLQQYHVVPWFTEYRGDILKEKPGRTWLWKLYLVPLVSEDPEPQLSFDDIYVLDATSASLQRCEVHRLAPPDTPQADLRLRIRQDIVTIDRIESIPTWEHAVQARMNGVPALSQLEMQRLDEYLNAVENARDLGTIDEAEFQAAYDVHWLAGMQAGGKGAAAVGDTWEADEKERLVEEEFIGLPGEDAMGGYDEDYYKDLIQDEFDDESEETDFEEFDSPAADY